ncbi:Sulfotransferase domain-containig protein [metagenome]|uniref:Sulfotransferase domain-containig protein n=1 Tax=metagenome TaxID=256318 RepID=A0A2P2BZB4_9ZZZZ
MSNLVELKERSPRWLKDAANLATRKYAVATVSQRTMPDFLVIGTKRGGTTSLFNYLMMHPGILGLFPQSRAKKSSDYFFKQQHHGETWYRSHFHTSAYRSLKQRRLGYATVAGEASPYYLWDPRIAGAVHAFSPSMKAIALVRDPVERAWSHYQERTANGVEPLSFPDALRAEDDRLQGELEAMDADPVYYSEAHDWYSYRSRGIYLPQLQNWRATFPDDQLLVLRSEDMYADVQGTFDTICEFLGVPPFALPTTRTFGAGRRSTMPEESRAELTEFYAPHNAALETYLGRELGWSR